MHDPSVLQGQRGRGGRGPAGGILQRGRNQSQGQGGTPPTPSALPPSAVAPPLEALAAAVDPAGATAAELQVHFGPLAISMPR